MGELKRFNEFTVSMYNFDVDMHHFPHIHVNFKNGTNTVIKIEDGSILAGEEWFQKLSKRSKKTFYDWLENNREEIMNCWDKAVTGEIEIYKIG